MFEEHDYGARASALLILLVRGAARLREWHAKYGEHQPPWLPPAGDVRWLEDVEAAIHAGAAWNLAACEVEHDAAKCWRQPCADAGRCTTPDGGRVDAPKPVKAAEFECVKQAARAAHKQFEHYRKVMGEANGVLLELANTPPGSQADTAG